MSSAPPIVIMGFTGEQPRIISRLLPDNAASAAIDTKLDDGGLTPLRDTPLIDAVGVSASWKTIYFYRGDWIGWNYPNVWAAAGPVAQDRLYYMGDAADPTTAVPKMRIDTTIYNLAVPRPTVKLTMTIGGTPGPNPITYARSYTYSFVTNINGITEESEPAPPATIADWKTGQSVTLSGFQNPSDLSRGIATQRIYRLQTGLSGTYFYLIAERGPPFNADYNDIIAIDKTAEPCPSINYNAPQVGLQGLVAMPNGMMAAYLGKKVYFCEPYKPHAWPEIYSLTCEHNIVGLGAIANSLVIMTDAHPYFATGSSPAGMQMTKLEHNLPCVNNNSIVDLGYAIAYASVSGLAVARGDGSIGMASTGLFTREEWEDYQPTEIIGCQLDGRYVAFYSRILDDGTKDEGALFFDLGNPTFLFRTATTADAVYYSIEQSALFYKPPGKAEIREIDADNAGRRILYWRSKEFVLPYPENYGAFMVDGDVDTQLIDETSYNALVDAAKARNLNLIINGGTYTWKPWPAPPPYTWTAPMDGVGTPQYPGSMIGGIGGDLDAMLVNDLPVNGDILEPLPYQPVSVMTCGIYCDKKLVGSAIKANTAVRLPSGFRGRTWEIDIFTNQRIHRIAMAKNMDDLKRLP